MVICVVPARLTAPSETAEQGLAAAPQVRHWHFNQLIAQASRQTPDLRGEAAGIALEGSSSLLLPLADSMQF